jgi:hypothetical protein
MRLPRVAKAQPWAEIGQRFQRYSILARAVEFSTFCAKRYSADDFDRVPLFGQRHQLTRRLAGTHHGPTLTMTVRRQFSPNFNLPIGCDRLSLSDLNLAHYLPSTALTCSAAKCTLWEFFSTCNSIFL